MVRGAADMLHAVIAEPVGEIAGDVGGTIVAEQPGLVHDSRRITA